MVGGKEFWAERELEVDWLCCIQKLSWGCWKTGRASGSGLGGDAGPPPSSGLPWATAAFKRPPDPAHICTDLPGTYLVGELGVGR